MNNTINDNTEKYIELLNKLNELQEKVDMIIKKQNIQEEIISILRVEKDFKTDNLRNLDKRIKELENRL